jgi:hypothetical protein
MAILRPLDRPEIVETKKGIRKVTHEIYSYAITPFQVPPIKVHTYKGTFDGTGRFQVLVDTQFTLEITQAEFKGLLDPNPKGKKAGDFRLSDVLELLRKRDSD